MPDHKNQHYVPRCHLRPFSLDGESVAINVFNIARSRPIQNAPVKGQCAKDYFYGSDLGIEKALQAMEGHYARIIRIIQTPSGQPSTAELGLLRGFALLQYWRTDMAMRRARMMHEGMHNAVYEGKPVKAPDLDVSDRTMMIKSMRMFATSHRIVDDLKICIIQNETAIDFVTSDDPSIVVSKYMAQREGTNHFGLGSTGVLFFLPLTPRACLMCYDGDAYTIADKQGNFLPITDPADTDAINELQYLKAASNIYFAQWNDRDRLAKKFALVSPRRPQSWCEFVVWVPDGTDAVDVGGDVVEVREHYRRATDEERRTARQTMVQFSSLHPIPSRWISKLRYRDPVKTYGRGTGTGPVREATWDLIQERRSGGRGHART